MFSTNLELLETDTVTLAITLGALNINTLDAKTHLNFFIFLKTQL
jgi:hypothetical protein